MHPSLHSPAQSSTRNSTIQSGGWLLRPANARGSANHGWLKSAHSFSFASYYDPQFMGFSRLRVINDDRVAAGMGFGMHPHRDMEIFSYILSGALSHKDSAGNQKTVGPGDVQLISAGRGISHSEFNPSSKDPVHFLQIWLEPNQVGGEPLYLEQSFNGALESYGLVQIVAHSDSINRVSHAQTGPEKVDGALQESIPRGQNLRVVEASKKAHLHTSESVAIKQDARIYALRLESGQTLKLTLDSARSWYVHTATGSLTIGGQPLSMGDALYRMHSTPTQELDLMFAANGASEVLIFDLP